LTGRFIQDGRLWPAYHETVDQKLDNNAEEAMNFYTSIFKNSKIGSVSRYGESGPGPGREW